MVGRQHLRIAAICCATQDIALARTTASAAANPVLRVAYGSFAPAAESISRITGVTAGGCAVQ